MNLKLIAKLIAFMVLLVAVLACSVITGGFIEAECPMLGQLVGVAIFFGGLWLMGRIDWLEC